MAWDSTVQRRAPLPPMRIETGRVTIADVSGQTFTVSSKFSRVFMGMGILEGDGMPAFATTGSVSGGTVTFTRLGAIATETDVISYSLLGY